MVRHISKPKRFIADQRTHLPTRDEILSFISQNPDKIGKRDIAKAFHLKGDAKISLKNILRDLAHEGLIEKRNRRLIRSGTLPHIAVLDIMDRDTDGHLIARPVEWDISHGDKIPDVLLVLSRSMKGPAPGVGDRILAKIFPSHERIGPGFTGRMIKRLERHRNGVLGVLRFLDDQKWRIEPVERRQAELIVSDTDLNGAKSGDLVEVEVKNTAHYGLSRGVVRQVIGSIDNEKALSMIAIHAHEIPYIFSAEVLHEAETIKPATMAHREDWCIMPFVTIDPDDAKDHDDAVFANPDTDASNPGGCIITVAIADVAAYVLSGSALDHEALKRGNSVYFPDRVVPMLPERISNDLCSLKEGVNRPALAVRMIFTADGLKRSHTFHHVMMRSIARLTYPQAQAAIDGVLDEKTAPIIEIVLKPLWVAYEILKRGRTMREPLELDLPERKILLTPDGQVDRIDIPHDWMPINLLKSS